ncbi:SDR family oxidoreductase [Saccharopolyspora sp. NPDC002686]|uniref:SDR family NAD(P)-dependent oxidoreductase n=1 Tax=Saccharopolyspora sp. NPDC002686 TaxID=3154541 RepID=UPI0033202F7A
MSGSTEGQGVVVVTGAASGLGARVAERASAEGWTVAAIDVQKEALAALDDATVASRHEVDVRDAPALRRVFAVLREQHGRIHGLVNSAGLTRPGPSATLSEADWRLVVDVDLSGTFFACQAAFDHLDEGASIVNIASIAAARGLPERAAYSAAKSGVAGLTNALAAEWGPLGHRVNAVGPAWTNTPLIQAMVRDGVLDRKSMTDAIPLGRLCTEDDVADAVLFLLSDRAAFVNGQTLYVDGGYTTSG